ncbi:MAG: PEP-CTERM sorting domain-containing protein, partial [Opitutales bacterium]|nr:PEP-CTERM sorting domain-containing protein [Opitutales bacterium]
DDDSSLLSLTRTDAGAITGDASMRVYVYGFEDNRIYVGEHQNTYNILDRIIAYGDKEGKETIGALTINNGWLVSAAVPEPAEWAMILGALALGLAIYRKRK